jgi:hypothetical protein
MSLDDRLRAAGDALKEASATQVDAATGLREILLHADPAPEETTIALGEPTGTPAPAWSPRDAARLRRPQRLALAVNLLLVVAMVVLLVVTVQRDQTAGPASAPTRTTAAAPATSVVSLTRVTVPDECLDAAELADEVISRLNRNVRDQRLFKALRDYTIASQACRREASP